MTRSHPLSLPREHGAYLTLAGAIIVGALMAPQPGRALAAGLALVAGFLARGPLERRAAGLGWRAWDRPALAICACAAAGGAHLAGRGRLHLELALLAAALSLPLLGWLVRRLSAHRNRQFELVGMGLMGACAGLIAYTGGAAPALAAAIGVVLGVHSAASVPLVRATLRPRERATARRGAALTGVTVALIALAVAAAGAPYLALALTPRGLDATLKATVPPRRTSAARMGMREVALLLLVVLTVAIATR